MKTLYKLNEQYQELLDKLTYEEVENEEELLNELTQILISIEEKAENTAIIIKKLDAEADMIRKEEKRLADRRRAIENNAKFLKSNLEYSMILQDKKKFKTEHFSFNIQKNAPSVKIKDEEKALEHYKRVTESIDKAKLKDDLKNGVALDYAELVQTESLRIR